MGNSDHVTTYMRDGGGNGQLRPWHYIYVHSIESRLTRRVIYKPLGGGVADLQEQLLVLCIKPTSSVPELQIPILHCEINYDSVPRAA